MAYNHRIDTEELDTQLVVPVQGTSGLQVVIGTAPVNLAEEPEAVVNTPVIVNNMPEAQKILGYSDDLRHIHYASQWMPISIYSASRRWYL